MPTRILFLVSSLLLLIATSVQGADSQSGIIKGNSVNLRSEPGLEGRIISVLQKGLTVSIVAESESWYKAQLPDGQTGWIYHQYLELNPSPQVTSGERSGMFPVAEILTYAKNLLGINYVYGGDSPRGFDCSGFTMYVFAKFGIRLPHQSNRQIEFGAEIPTRDQLNPGDLVFFKTMGSRIVNHVGIYLGDNRFIHASSGYGAVRISPLDSGYYDRCYVGGRRLIDNDAEETSVS